MPNHLRVLVQMWPVLVQPVQMWWELGLAGTVTLGAHVLWQPTPMPT